MAEINYFLEQAVELARRNAQDGGRPFGAVLVKQERVIATGVNEIALTGDPTAHAELQAIRAASRELKSPRLDGCVLYASGHPCPMCLSAAYLCGIEAVYYALSNEEAEPFGLSTAKIYAQLARPVAQQSLMIRQIHCAAADDLYAFWSAQSR